MCDQKMKTHVFGMRVESEKWSVADPWHSREKWVKHMKFSSALLGMVVWLIPAGHSLH